MWHLLNHRHAFGQSPSQVQSRCGKGSRCPTSFAAPSFGSLCQRSAFSVCAGLGVWSKPQTLNSEPRAQKALSQKRLFLLFDPKFKESLGGQLQRVGLVGHGPRHWGGAAEPLEAGRLGQIRRSKGVLMRVSKKEVRCRLDLSQRMSRSYFAQDAHNTPGPIGREPRITTETQFHTLAANLNLTTRKPEARNPKPKTPSLNLQPESQARARTIPPPSCRLWASIAGAQT